MNIKSLIFAAVKSYCPECEELLKLQKEVTLHFVEAGDFITASQYCLRFIDSLSKDEKKLLRVLGNLLNLERASKWIAVATENSEAKKILALVFLYYSGRHCINKLFNDEKTHQQIGLDYLNKLKDDPFAENALGYRYEQSYFGFLVNDITRYIQSVRLFAFFMNTFSCVSLVSALQILSK